MKVQKITAFKLLLLLSTVGLGACAPASSVGGEAGTVDDSTPANACPAAGNEVIGPNSADANVGIWGIGDSVQKAKAAGDAAVGGYKTDASKCGACAQTNTAEVYVTTKPRPSGYKCPTVGGPWKVTKAFSQQTRDCKAAIADEVQGWFQQTFQKGKGAEGKDAYDRCGDSNCSFEIAQSVDGPNVTAQSDRDCTATATAKVEYKCVDYRDGWDVFWEVRHSWTCAPKAP